LSIVGNRGFSADGFVDSGETRVTLATSGGLPAASTISTHAEIEGPGFVNGRATLDGQSYSDVNGLASTECLDVDLSATIHLPDWRNAPVTISAPFEAAGFFFGAFSPSSQFQVPIHGSGKLTVNLSPEPSGTWAPDTFRYDFVATPTPEPTTLTLVTGGLVASALRARRRRDL
jgi:hypothetical protein